MKSEHTQSSSRTPNVTHDEIEIPRRIFVEDMSVGDISVDAVEDTNKEELITEMKRCRKCMFEATDEDELEVHLQNSHGQGSDSNLIELNIETSQTVESSTTYNCDECLFTIRWRNIIRRM